MTYVEFHQDYNKISEETPSYRIGQHFINLFIEDESDPLIKGLWQANHADAMIIIFKVMWVYQWDQNDMPLIVEGGLS